MSETILITGGTGKFGRCFVRHFANKGWDVVFTTTSDQRGRDFICEAGFGSNVRAFVADLAQERGSQSLLHQVESAGIQVNHLVNNARNLESLAITESGETLRKDFLGEYLMDVVVPYELSCAFFRTQGEALKTVTNIGSQYGEVAANPHLYDDYLNQSPIQYGVAKAALSHMTKELAVRFSSKSVRVNCIAYGGVEGRVDDAFRARYADLVPTGRMLTESELAGPLELIIDDGCGAVTGHTLNADGGWTIW